MPHADTEIRLTSWRDGSTQAERLAAAVLRLEGYEDIDPQAPLGGADDKKDILCTKGGRTWVAAVFFPPTNQSFRKVRTKFQKDLEGVRRHHRDGIVFFTNQRLTLSERESLGKLSLKKRKESNVYHVERIRHVLDSPAGYGIRIEFLRIPMSLEEQLAYFALSGNNLETAIRRNTAQLNRLSRQIEQLRSGQAWANQSIQRLAQGSVAENPDITPPPHLDPLSLDSFVAQKGINALTAELSPALILSIHRLVCFDLPARMIGHYRTGAVYIARRASSESEYQPPEAKSVPGLLMELCGKWNEQMKSLPQEAEGNRVKAIATFFHAFMALHPFLDGNGRTGRALLMQQCLDLFGRADMSLLDRGAEYFKALQVADRGNIEALLNLIRPVVAA